MELGVKFPFLSPHMRPHYHVAPSESLGLCDSAVTCPGCVTLWLQTPSQHVLRMFGATGCCRLHFLPAGVRRSMHEIANVLC